MAALKYFVSLCVFLLCASAAFSEDAAPKPIPPGYIALPFPFKEDIEKTLTAVREGGIVAEFSSGQKPVPEEIDVIWRGNESEIITDVHNGLLQFSKPPVLSEDGSVLEAARSFYLFFDFSQELIQIKSSRTGLTSPEGAFILKPGLRKMVPLTAAGEDDYRMLIVVPRFSSKNARAAFFCPRVYNTLSATDTDSTTQMSGRSLVDSGFRLVSTKFDASGRIRGKVVSGVVGPALVSGTLLTSMDIYRGTEYSDKVFSRDPRISIEYLKSKEPPPLESDVSNTPITERVSGIQGALNLQNSVGYTRHSVQQEAVYIKELAFPGIEPIKISEDLTQGEGPCYLLAHYQTRLDTYGKEALVLPERLAND